MGGSGSWGKMKMSSLQPNLSPVLQNIANNKGTRVCFNHDNNVFWCAAQDSCCGNGCATGPCCTNYDNYEFGCGKGSECCGNACMSADSKCCKTPSTGYEYLVTKDTECNKDQSVQCFNKHGAAFLCGAGSTCCGNSCAGEGSKCCTNSNGYKYPVTKDTACCLENLSVRILNVGMLHDSTGSPTRGLSY